MHSGDIGHIDSEGYLQITDRIKDVIKSGGEWVSSLDLEDYLSRHPAVAESAAIAIPDEKWGERPMMVVALKADAATPPDSVELHRFMQEGAAQGMYPKYGVPERFEFVSELPKTSVGKLDKKVMRQQYI